MDYIYISNGIVYEIIPEENPIFPGVPVSARYAKEFLETCIPVSDSTGIKQGMIYEPDKGIFTMPAPQERPEDKPDTLESM